MKYRELIFFGSMWAAVSMQAALTVNFGSLGLQTTPGETNHVWADPPSPDTVFDRWVGDTDVLSDPYAWHTTALMPSAPAAVTATFKSSPAWTFTTDILNGVEPNDPTAIQLVYYFPANPVGVIFLFHGATGSAANWFTNNVENITFVRDAVAAGYAVAGLDSTDRANRQWDATTTSSNVDVVSVQSAIDHLVGLGLMNTGTPKFCVGMSNGGSFAPKPAYYLGFNACGIFCAGGQPTQIFNFTHVPTIWSLARNDDLYDHTSFLSIAQANLANLNAQNPSVPGELRENFPSPLYPRRFLRIPGLSATDSQTIYDSLNNGGFLDPSGYLLTDPTTSGWENVVPPRYGAYYSRILDQLVCSYSAHKLYSDFDNKVLQFFGAQRPAVTGRGAIRTILRQADGSVRLTIGADPGQTYSVQASVDLVTWTTLFTNSYSAGTFDFIDTDAPSFSQRFYRTISP